MSTSIAQKLKIKEGYTLLTLQAPENFMQVLGEMPSDVTISAISKSCQQIHWFVKNIAQLEEESNKVLSLLKDEMLLWIYFPKGSSKMQTDLTRDTLYLSMKKVENVHWLTLISFNDTWSAFSLRLKTEKDKKKEASPKQRPVFQYIDAVKKRVTLPADFSEALHQAENEKAFFGTLSFTNKKEYIEWIVSAKREETRNNRVKEAVERLAKKWKNPANR